MFLGSKTEISPKSLCLSIFLRNTLHPASTHVPDREAEAGTGRERGLAKERG